MSESGSRFKQNLSLVLTIMLLVVAMFPIQLWLVSVLPLPVKVGGPLRAKMLIIDDGQGGQIIATAKGGAGASIEFDDGAGNVTLRLATSNDGWPGVDLISPDGRPLVKISTTGTRPVVRVYDPDTKKVAWESGQ